MSFLKRWFRSHRRGWAVLDEQVAREGSYRKVARGLLPQLFDADAVADGARETQLLCEGLAVGLVAEGFAEDGRHVLVDVDPERRWNVPLEAALRCAKDNLILGSLDRWRERRPGVFVSPWKDGLDAARLCLPEIFRDVPLRGAPVVVAPSRDHVAVTGARDRDGLRTLERYAREACHDSEQPLPLLPLQLVGGEWWVPCPAQELAGLRGEPEAERALRVA